MSETWQSIVREFIKRTWEVAMPIIAGGIGVRLAAYTLRVIDEEILPKKAPEKNHPTHDLSYIWNSKN